MKFGFLNLILCFIVSVAISPLIIKWLYKLKFGQSILVYVEKHKQKSGTATMGGVIILLSGFVGYFVFYKINNILATVSMLSFLFFGIIGFLDDYIKIKYKRNEGLKPYQKIIAQFGIAIIIAVFVYKSDLVGSTCNIPFVAKNIDLKLFIIPFIVIVYLAIVNSVNLIDGLDGLCCGVSSIVIFTLTIIGMIIANNYGGIYLNELNNLYIIALGIVGAILGFLCFNSFPAKVFMGDTGSLAIGGFLASLVTFSRNYFLFIIVGVMFVLTALSVVMQVGYYKLTKKRIFKMAPLHHHFEQNNHECKVVSIYVILTTIISILSISLYL